MLMGFVLCVLCVLWCGLLIRTWACCSESGQPRPCTGQAARVRDRRPACERRGAAQHQARCNARKPAMWSLGLLIRTWACCSESGQPRPCTGQAARVRDRRPACGTRWSPSRCCMRPIRICACCRWVRDPIGWRCTPSDWVQRPLTGAAPPNGCSASRVTAALPIVQVPVGGGPPARSPHASLRLGVIDLEARPGPAAAPGHRFCPRVPQPSLLLPSEPGGCCGGMRQAVAVFDRCGIVK